MGMYDGIQQTRSISYDAYNERRAWMSCMVACMRFDNQIPKVHLARLMKICNLCEIFAFNQKGYISDFGECSISHMSYGPLKLIEGSIKYIQPDDYPTLFANCTELIFSGGVINDEQKSVLQYLADKLNIHETIAKMIIEVTLIKNKRDLTFFVPSMVGG